MNKMIQFAENTRTTTYFRDMAIAEIRLTYRVMEYLAPDATFPPTDLNTNIKDALLRERFEPAYEAICDEVISSYDCGSSSGSEALRVNTIELMAHLLTIYRKDVTDAREKRKIELIAELKSLEETEVS